MINNRTIRRSGVTLVELLVVVAIIGILAMMLVPAVMMAMNTAKNARIAIEVGNIDKGFKAYKAEFQDYPPNFSNAAAVNAHIKRLFPRSNISISGTLDPAEALVFWLQGYGPDPTNPFAGTRKPLMEFDRTRLVQSQTLTIGGVSVPVYRFVSQDGKGAPYVYLHSNGGSYGATYSGGQGGTARAYKSSVRPGEFVNADSFQIVSAGQDGNYGANADKSFPSGAGYAADGTDNDNITNFSEGTLGDKRD